MKHGVAHLHIRARSIAIRSSWKTGVRNQEKVIGGFPMWRAAAIASSLQCAPWIQKPEPLWVERSNKVLSFSPWPECQERKWRFRQFFHRLFGSSRERPRV